MPEDMEQEPKKELYTGPSERHLKRLEKKGEESRGPTFLELQRELAKESISREEREGLKKQRSELINEAADLGLFDSPSFSVMHTIKSSAWDEMYSRLFDQAQNLERAARGYKDFDPRWEGLVQTVVEGAAAKVTLSGLEAKRKEGPEKGLEKRHGFTIERVGRIIEDVENKYNLYPQIITSSNPELLVGSSLPKKERLSRQPIRRLGGTGRET